MTAQLTLTRQDLRRLAVARQHLADPTPVPMLDVIRNLGCLQLDPIRAVERTHLLVLWSRLGKFDEAELERLRWDEKALFEYWAHAASLVLTEELPVHRWFMQHKANGQDGYQNWYDQTPGVPDLHKHVLHRLRQEGPLFSRDFESKEGLEPSRWTNGRYVNLLLDYLWTRGEVVIAERQGNQRRWGTAEQFWPDWTPQEHWSAEEVCRYAAQKAVRALGAATLKQIKLHYTRGRYPGLPGMLKKLVAEGSLLEIKVTGNDGPLPGPWYLHVADLPLLRQLQNGEWQPRTTFLSPFDNLICDRDRTEALWDFFFRIEIYVPPAKREYGYYVLPILHGDQLIGRIDPKMDRKTRTLHIYNVYAELGAPKNKKVVREIGKAAASLATFLGAKQIAWGNVPEAWEGVKQVG